MTFKQFKVWCNNRATDGYWGLDEAVTCIETLKEINKVPFFKREKLWNSSFRESITSNIVDPTNKLIEKLVYNKENQHEEI